MQAPPCETSRSATRSDRRRTLQLQSPHRQGEIGTAPPRCPGIASNFRSSPRTKSLSRFIAMPSRATAELSVTRPNVSVRQAQSYPQICQPIAIRRDAIAVAVAGCRASQSSACVGVTYNIKRSVCIRKSRIGSLIHARNAATTGVLTDRTPAPGIFAGPAPRVRQYENMDATGNDRGSWIRGVSRADCESICLADNGCAGYTYNRLKATCIPKNVVRRLMSSSEPAMTGVVEGR